MFLRKIIPAAAIGIMLISGSCAVSKKSTKGMPVTMPEIEVKPNDEELTYRATPAKEWELIHTDIDIRFNIPERSAQATTGISLHPYYYATDSLVLDAKGMNIISLQDGNNKPLPYRYDTLQLSIRLDKTYTQQDTLKLNIRYTAWPYAFESGGGKAITDDRGLYFVNADGKEPYQPVQIWTQGETEANSHWFPTFDHTNFRSTFSITMHVPDSFKTLSNGYMSSSKKEANGLRADTWKQEIPIPPYLVMMAAANFAISKDNWQGKEVSYYVPQDYTAYSRSIFPNTPEMMGFFSDKLRVPYPWNKYSQVVVYDYVSGAMENVSASLFGSFNLKDNRQLEDDNNDYIVAHELFHQWFGDYVTAESWSNLTLNESFADYSEQLWSEHKYGEDARAEIWRQDLNKYLNQSKYKDPPLVRFSYGNPDEMFDRVSYSKGGLILHYLRKLTGDKAFYDALHLYLTQNALHSAEATQLRLAFEQVTGKDWNWFFNQWYYRGGHPKLEISYDYNDAAQKVTVTVLQKQSDSAGLYRLPVKAQIISGNNVKDTFWTIENKKNEFVCSYINGQRPIVIADAEHWIPGEIEDKKTEEQWLTQYKSSHNMLSRRMAINALADVELDSKDTAKQLLYLALRDKSPNLRRLAIGTQAYEGKKLPPKEWVNILGDIAAHDPDNKTRAEALNALGEMRNTEYMSTYELALQDSSYVVEAAALSAIDRSNHKRAVEYARNFKPEQMKANVLLFKAADIIAKDGKKEDFGFFEKKTWQLFEVNRSNFLNAVQTYLLHAEDFSTFSKGVDLLLKLAQNNPDAAGGFYAGAMIYNLKVFADKSIKIATEKSLIDDWKLKRETALRAWQEYKAVVKTESIKSAVAEMEKQP